MTEACCGEWRTTMQGKKREENTQRSGEWQYRVGVSHIVIVCALILTEMKLKRKKKEKSKKNNERERQKRTADMI